MLAFPQEEPVAPAAAFARPRGAVQKARDLHLEVRGRFAFLANARAGLRVLDLRQIAKGRLREVGFFDVEPEKNSSDWFGAVSLDVLPSGTVIVGSVRQGLFVLNARLPS